MKLVMLITYTEVRKYKRLSGVFPVQNGLKQVDALLSLFCSPQEIQEGLE